MVRIIIGVILGNGWYRSVPRMAETMVCYANTQDYYCKSILNIPDGSSEQLVTDETGNHLPVRIYATGV